MLSADNYQKGFLLDEELMAGITEVRPEGSDSTIAPQGYAAYVVRHTSGEYLGYREFANLDDALSSLNTIAREWHFESASGCGACGDGGCKVARGGKCGHGKKEAAQSEAAGNPAAEPPVFTGLSTPSGPSL